MNTELLKTFLVMAETLNFRIAAKELFLAQSTVSFRIRELETIFQEKLFEKEGKLLKITAAGEKLIPYAKDMIALEMKMRSNLKQGTEEETLRLVGVESVFEGYLFPWVSEYMKKNPVAHIEIKEMDHPQLLECLRTEKAHLGFSYHPATMDVYENTVLWEDAIVLVTHKKNTQYKEGITLEELIKVPLCFVNVFSFTDELAEWYHQIYTSEFQFHLICHSFDKIIEFLCDGEGYCFLPKNTVKKQIEEGTLQMIPLKFKAPPVLPVYAIKKKTSKEALMVSEFVKILS